MYRKLAAGFRAIALRIRQHHIFAFAATSAFFLLMSFIPFILVLLVMIRFTSLSETDMMNTLIQIVPSELEKFVTLIVKEVYTKSIAVVPISIVIALWSAAKGFHALSYGLNVIENIPEPRGWFYMRFRSMIYTLIFVLSIMGALFLMVFSKGIRETQTIHLSYFTRFILSNRYILSCILLTVLFIVMYRFLPNRKADVMSLVPGALLVGIAWTAFSWLLSIFYSPKVMNMYGSLTAIILAMVWMYFCMYFFLFGALLNNFLAQAPEENMILSILRDMYFTYYSARERKQINQKL